MMRMPLRLEFTAKEREAILGLASDDSGVSEQLEKAAASGGHFHAECSPDDLDFLLDSIAAEANHCEDGAARAELDALYDRLQEIQDAHASDGDQAGLEDSGSREPLNAAIRRILDNQLEAGDPPETKQTLDRLRSSGLSDSESRRLISCVIAGEIFDIMKHRRSFNQTRFLERLAMLPDVGWLD